MDAACRTSPAAAAGYTPLQEDPYSAHQLVLAACRGARTVLDVGCSTGTLAAVLSNRGVVVDGIERDPVAAMAATAVCRHVVAGDVTDADLGPLAGERYDAVLLADVLEHTAEPAAMLRRLRPLLTDGGRLIISTPNVANWSMRLLLLAGRFEYRDRGILDRTHLHLFTRRSLLRLLHETGHAVTNIEVSCPLPHPLRTPALSRLAHRAARALPGLLAYQFVITAVAREHGSGG